MAAARTSSLVGLPSHQTWFMNYFTVWKELGAEGSYKEVVQGRLYRRSLQPNSLIPTVRSDHISQSSLGCDRFGP